MLFNSTQFLLFFVIVYALYLFAAVRQRQNMLLLVASYVFYGAWDWRFLPLILGSTLVDYFAAMRIESSDSQRARRCYLLISLVFNLGILGFFKYYNFGIESFASLLESFGLQPNLSTLQIILPVGISFYTFQTISYTVDVYQGERHAVREPLDFALYVAYFPQLVAGPIERSVHLLPQIQSERSVSGEDLRIGFLWVLLGFFKKVVIADTLAPLVDRAFAQPDEVSGIVSLLSLLGFAVQIYGDFAGYTLIARGISRMMGIDLIRNFRRPYLAASPRDFWKRWHISLSSWLQHYLYFSLGGSRGGAIRTYKNLTITMLLGGLWHGAAWNFVLWGGYHGALLVACHAVRNSFISFRRTLLANIIQITGMFVLTLFGWLLFRVSSLDNFIAVTTNILFNFKWNDDFFVYFLPVAASFFLLLSYHVWQERTDDELLLLKIGKWWRFGVYVFLASSIFVVGFRDSAFIYFQF